MNPKLCENAEQLEDRPWLRRCKITGYLCKPTVFDTSYGNVNSQCVFEPQYLNGKYIQNLIKIIPHIKPGTRVWRTFRENSGYYKKDALVDRSGTITKIDEYGQITVKFDGLIGEYGGHSIHRIGKQLHLTKESAGKIRQKLEEEQEIEERIRKEGREDE